MILGLKASSMRLHASLGDAIVVFTSTNAFPGSVERLSRAHFVIP